MKIRFLVFCAAVLGGASAHSGLVNYKADYERLLVRPANYQVFGTICEELARLRLEEQFSPKNYYVVTGIQYRNSTRTIGELDVVVFRNSDHEAVMVGEVKCWRRLGEGRAKAEKQLHRFEDTMKSGMKIRFVANGKGDPKKQYSPQQFDERPDLLSISQEGGRTHGFDMCLNYDLDQVQVLRNAILHCQETGRCKNPF